MKTIDAHTGLEVHVGDRIPLPDPRVFSTPESSRARMQHGLRDYYYEVVAIRPGLFKASMDARFVDAEGNAPRLIVDIPLTVRWTHPAFPLQRVAFVPT